MSGYKKNTAVTGFCVGMISASDGSAITTGTVNGFVTLDGGTQASLTNALVHEGNGQWSVNLTAGEMNGDIVGLVFTHTSAIPAYFTIKTDTKLVSELQDLTAAQVNAECDTALTDYNAVVPADLPTNFADLAITASTGRVDINANNDKAGYSISGTKTTLDALNDVSAAAVNAEVADVVNTDTHTEIGQEAFALPASLSYMIRALYKCLRNEKEADATGVRIKNDAGTVVDQKLSHSQAGGVYSRGEFVSGP